MVVQKHNLRAGGLEDWVMKCLIKNNNHNPSKCRDVLASIQFILCIVTQFPRLKLGTPHGSWFPILKFTSFLRICMRPSRFFLTSMLSLAQVREETEHPWSMMNYLLVLTTYLQLFVLKLSANQLSIECIVGSDTKRKETSNAFL